MRSLGFDAFKFRIARIWLATSITSFATMSAASNEMTGLIVTQGRPGQRQTYIKTPLPDTNETVRLCRSPLYPVLTQLAGMTTTLTGSIKSTNNDSKSITTCFNPESYVLIDIAKGRPAIVGQLQLQADHSITVKGAHDKIWYLAKSPPAIKDLLNRDVILDLVAAGTANGHPIWLVARAIELPKI